VKQISSHFTITSHNDKESLSSPITTCSRFDKIDRGRRRLNQAQRKGGRRRRRKSEAFFACDFDFKGVFKGVYREKSFIV
jgi:hypothetical protein